MNDRDIITKYQQVVMTQDYKNSVWLHGRLALKRPPKQSLFLRIIGAYAVLRGWATPITWEDSEYGTERISNR